MRRALILVSLALAAAAGLSQACQSRVPHDLGEEFPLVGLHAPLPCDSCHVDGTFGALDPACEACHEADRPGADHYPDEVCADCHTAYGWLVFTTPTDSAPLHPCLSDHTTCLPLVDAHDVSCSDCHLEPGQYVGLERRCGSCHEEERPAYHYDGQDCESCHPPTVWAEGVEHPVTLPHFDAPCEGCHLDPVNRADLTCFEGGCHGKPETDQIHDGFYGYAYTAPKCLECHPDGSR